MKKIIPVLCVLLGCPTPTAEVSAPTVVAPAPEQVVGPETPPVIPLTPVSIPSGDGMVIMGFVAPLDGETTSPVAEPSVETAH